jgi:hypothetical protein
MQSVQILSFRTYSIPESTPNHVDFQTYLKTIQCILSSLYFVVYLTMLSKVQTVQRRTIERLMNDEMKRMWKEAVVA